MRNVLILLFILIGFQSKIKSAGSLDSYISMESTLPEVTVIYKYNIDSLKSKKLRRDEIKSYYNEMFIYISKRTSLPKEFIYSYFIWEANNSQLWLKYNNPGGIKGKGVKYKDDCGSVKCSFRKFSTLKQGVDKWINVFNNKRYKRCKELSIDQCFKCFQEQGYHSADSWKQRLITSKQYYEKI